MVIFWLVVAMLIGAFLSGVGIGITYDTTLAPILAGIIAGVKTGVKWIVGIIDTIKGWFKK